MDIEKFSHSLDDDGIRRTGYIYFVITPYILILDFDSGFITGTTKTCVAHIIASVIGSGVLSLAWGTAQLGWIGGPVAMIFFAIITYISAFLLSDCYRSPDSVTGARNNTYMDAVRVNLGQRQTFVCGFLQYLSMFGAAITYTITTSASMRYIYVPHPPVINSDGSVFTKFYAGQSRDQIATIDRDILLPVNSVARPP